MVCSSLNAYSSIIKAFGNERVFLNVLGAKHHPLNVPGTSSSTARNYALALAYQRTYPSVVMVTIVYQNAAGIEVKLVPSTFFSA